jgi:hypothetical protein
MSQRVYKKKAPVIDKATSIRLQPATRIALYRVFELLDLDPQTRGAGGKAQAVIAASAKVAIDHPDELRAAMAAQ